MILLLLVLELASCRKSDGKPSSTEIGTSEVDLDASENLIRKKETLLGNLISDALKEYFDNKNEIFDFVLTNGGNIRFDSQLRPNGIYPKGILTSEMVDEMLPFGNSSVIVELTGAELKEILERSVAQYPLAKGPFLHPSKELFYQIDTTKQSQIINIDETVIITPGDRIDSILINGVCYSPTGIYNVLFSEYIGDGNDGYVTLKNLSSNKKKYFTEFQTNALKDYIILNSPISPKLEGRIKFN